MLQGGDSTYDMSEHCEVQHDHEQSKRKTRNMLSEIMNW